MPRMTDVDTEQHKVPKGNFTYSAAKIGQLGASEFTLITIVNDVSSSVSSFKDDMESTLGEIVRAADKSPRRDNLLMRHLQFATNVSETHGFNPLDSCKPDDYNGSLRIGGSTSLFDATRNAILSTSHFAQQLSQQRFQVNAIVVVITDGCDNASASGAEDVKKALAEAMKDESLESILTILVGVGIDDSFVAQQLDAFHRLAGFTQYVEQKKADAATLAKLAEFVSKSISATSQALGTGSVSTPLKF